MENFILKRLGIRDWSGVGVEGLGGRLRKNLDHTNGRSYIDDIEYPGEVIDRKVRLSGRVHQTGNHGV